jgi:hypothetical protein
MYRKCCLENFNFVNKFNTPLKGNIELNIICIIFTFNFYKLLTLKYNIMNSDMRNNIFDSRPRLKSCPVSALFIPFMNNENE